MCGISHDCQEFVIRVKVVERAGGRGKKFFASLRMTAGGVTG